MLDQVLGVRPGVRCYTRCYVLDHVLGVRPGVRC